MANMKPRFSTRIVGMRLSGHCAAHLAGEAVPVEHISSGFLGDAALKGRQRFEAYQNILARFQVAPVVVGLNVHSFFVPQFSDPSGPFAYAAGDFAEFV